MESITIVTGTPGVGKTALSTLLASETRSELLNVGELVKKEKLYRAFDHPSRSYIIDEQLLRRRLEGQFKSQTGRGLVVETHWIGNFMPRTPEMVAIVVRLDPVTLARRLMIRKWPKKKIWENVEAELIDLSLYESIKFLGARRVYQIDATRKRPRELLIQALKLLSTGKGWDRSTPDWLARYDPVKLSKCIL